MKLSKFALLLPALAAALATTSGVAAAAPPHPKKVAVSPAGKLVACQEETLTGTIKGTVEAAHECSLDDATVKGSVTVEPGGELTTYGTVDVRGSVKATDPRSLALLATGTISGSVEVVNPTRYTSLEEGTVKHNVIITGGTTPKVLSQQADSISITSEKVGKNLEITNNVLRQYYDVVYLFGSTVEGNLEIEENELGETGDFDADLEVEFTTIQGGLRVEKNHVSGGTYNYVDVYSDNVEKNLEVENNSALTVFGEIETGHDHVGGSETFSDNDAENVNNVYGGEIAGALTCEANTPAPGDDSGTANTAKEKLGQCATL